MMRPEITIKVEPSPRFQTAHEAWRLQRVQDDGRRMNYSRVSSLTRPKPHFSLDGTGRGREILFLKIQLRSPAFWDPRGPSLLRWCQVISQVTCLTSFVPPAPCKPSPTSLASLVRSWISKQLNRPSFVFGCWGSSCCSVAQLCLTLCNPMGCIMPGFPVLLREFVHSHVHWVGDAIQPYHLLSPLLLPSVFPSIRLLASGGQRIRASAPASVLPMNIQGWFPLGLTGLIAMFLSFLYNLPDSSVPSCPYVSDPTTQDSSPVIPFILFGPRVPGFIITIIPSTPSQRLSLWRLFPVGATSAGLGGRKCSPHSPLWLPVLWCGTSSFFEMRDSWLDTSIWPHWGLGKTLAEADCYFSSYSLLSVTRMLCQGLRWWSSLRLTCQCRVQSLVQEDSTWHGTAKSMHHCCWARVLQSLEPQEKLPRWEACALQLETSSCSL